LPPGRQAYLLCIEGSVQVNGKQLTKYDACEISESGALEIEATAVEETENGKVAHILMFVMKEVPGSGRKDVQ
jgi:redox-sensitive bicupin YhaK (pirin superfamily)